MADGGSKGSIDMEVRVAVLEEQRKADRRDFDQLEASVRWAWRTIITTLIGGLATLMFWAVQNGISGG